MDVSSYFSCGMLIDLKGCQLTVVSIDGMRVWLNRTTKMMRYAKVDAREVSGNKSECSRQNTSRSEEAKIKRRCKVKSTGQLGSERT